MDVTYKKKNIYIYIKLMIGHIKCVNKDLMPCFVQQSILALIHKLMGSVSFSSDRCLVYFS